MAILEAADAKACASVVELSRTALFISVTWTSAETYQLENVAAPAPPSAELRVHRPAAGAAAHLRGQDRMMTDDGGAGVARESGAPASYRAGG